MSKQNAKQPLQEKNEVTSVFKEDDGSVHVLHKGNDSTDDFEIHMINLDEYSSF